MRAYMAEEIEQGCQKAVHDRIISDSLKVKSKEMGRKLRIIEKKLYIEAESQDIAVNGIRKEINQEFAKFMKT